MLGEQAAERALGGAIENDADVPPVRRGRGDQHRLPVLEVAERGVRHEQDRVFLGLRQCRRRERGRREEQQAAEDFLHRQSIRCGAAASPRSGASHHEIVPLLRHFLGRRARRAPPREARSTGRRCLCGTAGPRSPAARTSRLARAQPGAGAAPSPRIRRTGESAVPGAPAGARRSPAASSDRRLAGRETPATRAARATERGRRWSRAGPDRRKKHSHLTISFQWGD